MHCEGIEGQVKRKAHFLIVREREKAFPPPNAIWMIRELFTRISHSCVNANYLLVAKTCARHCPADLTGSKLLQSSSANLTATALIIQFLWFGRSISRQCQLARVALLTNSEYFLREKKNLINEAFFHGKVARSCSTALDTWNRVRGFKIATQKNARPFRSRLNQ